MSHYPYFTHFLPQLQVNNFEHLLQQLSWKIGATTSLDMTWVYAQLMHFEKQSSSAIGGGVVIPHLKSTPLTTPVSLLTTLKSPIEMESDDGRPIDICALILSPENDGNLHLQRLSRITRLLRDEELCQTLRTQETDESLRAVFQDLNPVRIAA